MGIKYFSLSAITQTSLELKFDRLIQVSERGARILYKNAVKGLCKVEDPRRKSNTVPDIPLFLIAEHRERCRKV